MGSHMPLSDTDTSPILETKREVTLNYLLKGIVLTALGAAAFSGSADAQVATRQGLQLGAQFSKYTYEEPSLDVHLTGDKVGLTGSYTYTRERWFAKADARYSYGTLRYRNDVAGSEKGIADNSLEARLSTGMDFFPSDSVSLSPYAGIGYRYLFNDMRGYTSMGNYGYRRFSQYLYVPLGVTSRFVASQTWTLVPTIEYDYFVKGRQESKLTDTKSGFEDAHNKQKSGYGARASLLFENGNWSLGPWATRWKIRQSDKVAVGTFFGRPFSTYEPENKTWEAGVEVRYHF
jgi:Autotransporter beta-domain